MAQYSALLSVVHMMGFVIVFDRMIWRKGAVRHARLLHAYCTQLVA